jgi:hypothetical protein
MLLLSSLQLRRASFSLRDDRNEEKHCKDLHVLILGPRQLRTLCMSHLVSHYDAYTPQQLATLPEDVLQHARVIRQVEQKRLRKHNRTQLAEEVLGDDYDDMEEEEDASMP